MYDKVYESRVSKISMSGLTKVVIHCVCLPRKVLSFSF